MLELQECRCGCISYYLTCGLLRLVHTSHPTARKRGLCKRTTISAIWNEMFWVTVNGLWIKVLFILHLALFPHIPILISEVVHEVYTYVLCIKKCPFQTHFLKTCKIFFPRADFHWWTKLFILTISLLVWTSSYPATRYFNPGDEIDIWYILMICA